MRKFLLIVITIVFAYFVSYYTVGEQKGYKLMSFNLDRMSAYLDSISKSEAQEKVMKDSLKLVEAIIIYNNKDYLGARERFRDILDDATNYEMAYYYLGRIDFDEQRFTDAVYNFEWAISYGYKNDDVYYYRALAYYNTSVFQNSLNDLKVVLKSDSCRQEAYYYAALNYENLENKDSALILTLNGIVKYPTYADLLANAGRLFYGEGKYTKAEEYYTLAIKNDTIENYITFLNRGLNYHEMNKLDLALKDYNKTIELKSDYYLAYNNRGYLYFDLKKYDQALEDYNKCIELYSQYATARINRGDLYYEMKEWDKAMEDFNVAASVSNGSAYVIFRRAQLFDQLNVKDSALALYNQYLTVWQDDKKLAYAQRRIKELNK